jgi:tRNA threonylcarbamoyladenosine biosynthesis protein TsaB
VQRGEMRHRAPEVLGEGLIEPTVLAGELTEGDAATLRSMPNVLLPEPAARRRRAATLIDLATPRWRSGEWDDLTTLEPVYVHTQPSESAVGATT